MKNIYLRSFSGVIWKLLIDRDSEQLFLEIRSEQSLDLSYFVLDLSPPSASTLEAVQYDLPEEIDWWSRPVFFYGDKILVQKYEDQTNPGPGPVYSIDLKTNEKIKLAEKFLIDRIENNQVSGTKFADEEKEPAIFEFKTSSGTSNQRDVLFPHMFQEGTEDFEIVAAFIERQKGLKPVLGIEYYEEYDNLFFTYYLKGHNISRFLMVINNGKIAIDQCIDRKVKGLSTESFFILADKLIFVEDRITLQVYEIKE